MDLFGNNKQQNKQNETDKNSEDLQSILDDAEQALEGDELQEAIKQKKKEQNLQG